MTGKWRGSIFTALRTKALAWEQIVDAGPEWSPESRVTRKLQDAWDTSKRSREYLNAAEGDIDTRYYAHAHTLPRGMSEGDNVASLFK